MNKAEALNDQILDSAGVSNPAGLGIDDALKLVDWVWNKVKGLNASKKDTFYCQLKWADYSDVVAGTTDKPCPANSSTPADSSKKKNGGR